MEEVFEDGNPFEVYRYYLLSSTKQISGKRHTVGKFLGYNMQDTLRVYDFVVGRYDVTNITELNPTVNRRYRPHHDFDIFELETHGNFVKVKPQTLYYVKLGKTEQEAIESLKVMMGTS